MTTATFLLGLTLCLVSGGVGANGGRRQLQSQTRKNDVTVAVNTDSISENGFEFSYDFDSVVPGAVMYYSLTEAGVQRYTAEDVQQGFDSIYHGSEDDVDTSRHTVTVNIPLEVSQTYLLWVAFGVGNDLELLKTNIVHVPKPCAEFVDIPHASSSCAPNSETCVATCDEGFGPGSSEFYCEIDGTWSGDLECLPMGCSATIAVPHAKSECTDTGVGAVCNVYCEEGYEGQGQYVCQLDGTWSGEVGCTERQAPVQCSSTVPGVQNGVSQCADTADGARCDVSCEEGYNGGGTYTCENGNWVGNAVCEANQAARFALWASGQFCEPEDFEHIYFGPVTSAAECAYKVSKNPYCTNKFYTGCCGSAVCACVRVGMRCELEESDEEYLGTNVYQLIGTGHPNMDAEEIARYRAIAQAEGVQVGTSATGGAALTQQEEVEQEEVSDENALMNRGRYNPSMYSTSKFDDDMNLDDVDGQDSESYMARWIQQHMNPQAQGSVKQRRKL